MRTTVRMAVLSAIMGACTFIAHAQTPFSGVKLQQGGATDPANGLVVRSNPGDYTTANGGNATMRFARPASTGVLRGVTYSSGLLDVNVSAIDLSANGAGGDVTNVLGISNGGTALSTAPGNGQLLIGNGTGYVLSTLTAGAGISITNNAGSITIASSTSNFVNATRFSLTAGQDTYTDVPAPTGFTLVAGSVVTITVQNGADTQQLWATVTNIDVVNNDFDFVLNGLPPASCTANIICMNP